MSRTWDLEVAGNGNNWLSGRLRFIETHEGINVETDYFSLGNLVITVEDGQARQIRDWLSWYLDEGPEPGGPL